MVSDEHEKVKMMAWAVITLYPLGLLAISAALLFSARAAIHSGRHTPLSSSLQFLYREFEPPFFWWSP